jgi:hypothetical protein
MKLDKTRGGFWSSTLNDSLCFENTKTLDRILSAHLHVSSRLSDLTPTLNGSEVSAHNESRSIQDWGKGWVSSLAIVHFRQKIRSWIELLTFHSQAMQMYGIVSKSQNLGLCICPTCNMQKSYTRSYHTITAPKIIAMTPTNIPLTLNPLAAPFFSSPLLPPFAPSLG